VTGDAARLRRGCYSEPGPYSVGNASSLTNLTAGKAAMHMLGSWFLGSVPKATAANFGSFLTPSDDGSVVVPYAVGGSMAVGADSPSPDKATAFAEAWSLDPANLKTLIEGDGAFPPIKGKTLADHGPVRDAGAMGTYAAGLALGITALVTVAT